MLRFEPTSRWLEGSMPAPSTFLIVEICRSPNPSAGHIFFRAKANSLGGCMFFLSTSPLKSAISVMHFWSQIQELELVGKSIHKIEDLKRILIEKVVKNQRPEIGQKIKGYPFQKFDFFCCQKNPNFCGLKGCIHLRSSSHAAPKAFAFALKNVAC